jgi:membrane-associated PAP2 superfamily phosphatase
MFWLISLLLILFLSLGVDLSVSKYFFQEGTFAQNSWLTFIYDYGVMPGCFLIGGAIFTLLFVRSWRREGLYLILVLVIGSGLIAHLALKEGWPRPRPKQVVEFGGQVPYHSLFDRHVTGGKFRSLPSGHATMGYYLLALVPIGRKRNKPWLVYTGLLAGLIMGGILSYTRIAQGGHFLTDTLMSFWVMSFTAFFLSPLLTQHERSHPATT